MVMRNSRFGKCNDFVTFLRFETNILLEYLHDLVEKPDNVNDPGLKQSKVKETGIKMYRC